eukprot:3310498-Amphidinium_carterae.1
MLLDKVALAPAANPERCWDHKLPYHERNVQWKLINPVRSSESEHKTLRCSLVTGACCLAGALVRKYGKRTVSR